MPVAAPWATPPKKDATATVKKQGGLLDIMSEQLAHSMSTSLQEPVFETLPAEFLAAEEVTSTSQETLDLDLALAAQLQEEEAALLYQDRHGPKGHVTVRCYADEQRAYLARQKLQEREADPGYDDTYGFGDVDAHATDDQMSGGGKKKTPPWPIRNKSLKGQGGDAEIVTKHDPEINGRKNARKLERSVPNCGHLGETIVPNKVFNDFQHRMRRAQHAEKGVSGRTVETDSTRTKSLDAKTRLVLHRMLDSGVLDAVNYVVRTGKEGVIFHAEGPAVYDKATPGRAPFPARSREDDDDEVEEDEADEELCAPDDLLLVDREGAGTAEFAVKVYKTSLTEFSNRHEYVEGDHRFSSLGQLSRQNKRKVVRVWAEKELKNLTRMFRAGLPCPEPVRLDKNVLVMSFIGQEGWGAPQLADLELSGSRAAKYFVQAVLLARAMWDRCKLVHADLSEFNILAQDGKCYIVDVGQAVERQHPHAVEFLRRDVFNVLAFFFNKCKGTGCGSADESVDIVLDLIMNGTPEPERNVDGLEWSEYAKRELGTWADYRVAVKLGELLS